MRMKRERGTGSLRLRGSIWWLRFFHNGRLVEESSKTSDEKQAKNLLRERLKDADTERHEPPQARRVRFEDLCDLIRRDYARKRNRSRIEQRLAHPLSVFAGRRALDITSEAIEQMIDARIAAGASIATANRDAAAVRRMFRLVVKKKILPKGSVPDIELRPEEDNARQDFLEAADLDAFLAALREREPVVADVTEAAFYTCLRRANVLGLTWPMLQLEVEWGSVVGGELRLPGTATKNKKPLALPLTGHLLALIARRWEARIPAWAYVFHRDGRPVVMFRSAWRAAGKAIGQPDLKFHGLRRSGARALRRLGVDEQTIMALGGWKTHSMFDRYAIVDSRDFDEAQQKLDALLATPGPRKVVALRRS
jgi:integrase